ncbi:Mitochondrial Carrier (MC) Family, partial [Achlya hypogyna]
MTSTTTNVKGVQSVLAGAFAGCVTRSCTSPLDVLKIWIQVNTTTAVAPTGFSVRHVCHHLYTHEGVRGFWKGNLAGCFRLGPYSGVKFFTFDTLQAQLCHRDAPSNVQHASCGAVAGMIATMTVYPMEVVRTRIIVQTGGSRRIATVLGQIYHAEGLRGLYRGGLSGLVGSVPFEGVQFACYEYCKSALLHRRLESA